MDIQEIMDKEKEYGVSAIREVIEVLDQKSKALAAEASKAVEVYFADVKQSEDRIAQRIQYLQEQQAKVDTKIKAAQTTLARAAAACDISAYNKTQEHLAALDKERASIDQQIMLLTTALQPRNTALYDAANVKYEVLHEYNTKLNATMALIHEFADAQADLWKKLAEDTATQTEWGKRNFGHSVPRYVSMCKHFERR